VSVLQLSALKGVFSDIVEDPVTFVNAPLHAAERGLEVTLTTSGDSPEYRNLVTLRGALATGEQVSVSGTLSGPRHIEKLTDVDGFDLDAIPVDHMVFLRYEDRPGVVGVVGGVLGEAGVNIAAMQVSRREAGGDTLMVLTVDSAPPPETLSDIVDRVGATSIRSVDLTTD
jgi:D-3-phosphoglycerate dehydrogenase